MSTDTDNQENEEFEGLQTVNKRVKFAPEVYSELQEFSKEHGVSVDELVNSAVETFITKPDWNTVRQAIKRKTQMVLDNLPL